jgi:hypothetical protein
MKLERDPKGDFFIDPSALADRLAVNADELRRRMRLGLVTSIIETGDGEDLGRQRLTLRSGNKVWRAVVDADQNILSEETFRLT